MVLKLYVFEVHTHPKQRQVSMVVDYGVEADGGPNKGDILEHTLVGRHASAQLDDSAAYCLAVNWMDQRRLMDCKKSDTMIWSPTSKVHPRSGPDKLFHTWLTGLWNMESLPVA